MQVEWYGQSAFRLSSADTTVAIDPFGDMSALAGSRGMQFDYPLIEGVEAQLLLVTHEHMDHNGVQAIGGDPTILRSTAGKLESPIGEITAISSEHDEAAGTELRPEQATAIGEVDLLILPVGGGPTIGAEGAAAIVERLSPRWVVPMHYRTPRIGFLETADAFLERHPDVHRLDGATFDTGELPATEGPLVVVPAAP
jgi:L-ascorbate metabolism protein UlaG (beta-lactamase superfamily)